MLVAEGEIKRVAAAIKAGGVVAYPTEGVFGLGCDPMNEAAFKHLFQLKQRPPAQGVLLICANLEQALPWINKEAIEQTTWDKVIASWPGPHTWVFPKAEHVPAWITGGHQGIALRVSAHKPAKALCEAFGGALVSTSANIHGHPSAMNVAMVKNYFAEGLAAILDAPLGGLEKPTSITDALTGKIIRA